MTDDHVPLTLQWAVHGWQASRFPRMDLALRGLKVGEEAGELQRALVRRIERRDGGDRRNLIEEACDLQVVLLGLAHELGFNLLEETVRHFQRLVAGE